MKGNLLTQSIFVLAIGQGSFAYAGEFYTIIAPDGRPMVVQQQKPFQSNAIEALKPNQSPLLVPPTLTPPVRPSMQPTVENSPVPVAQTLPKPQQDTDSEKIIKPSSTQGMNKLPAPLNPLDTSAMESTLKLLTSRAEIVPLALNQALSHDSVKQPLAEATENVVMIDGEKYIKNEYLENKEFNLDSKKRFYAMPEGIIDTKHGATRLQLVEREKGISKSLLQSFFKNNQKKDSGPIVLSSTYYRVSQTDAVESLGQACIQSKKLNKAKILSLDKEVNTWPRASLKDQFDFEVLKVSPALQNIQINSYASRQQEATFYWPFVVFLDGKGCVLEGAGGFKNHETSSSFSTHEKIEGIIHIPANSQYILLTPLASAIDLDNKALSNQGQLKLIAIR